MYSESRKSRAFHFSVFRCLTYGISFSLFALFISCTDDNPVKPKETTTKIIDSAMYDWQFINCDGYVLYDIYIQDTNRIFFASSPYLSFFDGTRLINIDVVPYYYFPQKVSGCDASNIYFGGYFYADPNNITEILWVKKWNGGSIETIPFPADTLRNGISDIFVNRPNDIWVAEDPGKILHYDGVSITQFQLPISGESLSTFFKNAGGELFIGGTKQIDTINWAWRFDLWKWSNNDWENFETDTIKYLTSPMQGRFFICGEDFIRSGIHNLYALSVNTWEAITDLPGIDPVYITGINKRRLLCSAYVQGRFNIQLILFNGSNWLLQSNFHAPDENSANRIEPIKMFSGYCIGCFINNTFSNNFFIGRPIKK